MLTKEEIVAAIANDLGIAAPPMSTGSTEPKDLFVAVNKELGLGLDNDLSKPELARGIVESAGFTWFPDYESRGSTVTAAGLSAVLGAVNFFLAD